MADPVPGGAFPDCAKFEQQLSTQFLGGPKAAWDSRSKSLVAMRTTVNQHETRIGTTESEMALVKSKLEDLLSRPF